MSGVASLPSSTPGIGPESFGPVYGWMPIPFWDGFFQFLLGLLEAECPEWPVTEKVNRALGHLQLMACGDAAAMSLAVSFLAFSFFFPFSFSYVPVLTGFF